MTNAPLMPKATAVWLVENTSLTFEQIAAYCGLHVLEVQGIADGDVAQGIRGLDPINSGQITRDELAKGQADNTYRLKVAEPKVKLPEPKKTRKGPRYTPLSRRQDRPNAILWLLRNHPELKDAQVMRLVGTTKPTIQSIRDRSHWNSANLQPQDPVILGLCTQIDLDGEVQKAAKRLEREGKTLADTPVPATLLSPEETMALNAPAEPSYDQVEEQSVEDVFGKSEPSPEAEADDNQEEAVDADSVFAKLKDLKLEDSEATDDKG